MARGKNNNHWSWLAEQLETPEARRAFEQERLVVTVTNALMEGMEQENVSRADLGRKLDRSRAFVTQVLAGTRNMTLHTFADMAWALGRRATFTLCDLARHGYRSVEVPNVEVRPKPQVISVPLPGESEPAPLAGAVAGNSELAMAA